MDRTMYWLGLIIITILIAFAGYAIYYGIHLYAAGHWIGLLYTLPGIALTGYICIAFMLQIEKEKKAIKSSLT